MSAPVVVGIRRGKAIMLGMLLTPITLICGTLFAFSIFEIGPLRFMTFVFLFITLAIGGINILLLGVALRRPIALRMDVSGVSGFHADPATWDEIADIAMFTGHKGHRFLGFTLHDPIAFRDRQTAWRRFTSWLNGRNSGHHIVVPEVLLKDANVDDLAITAQAFHAAARMPHNDVT